MHIWRVVHGEASKLRIWPEPRELHPKANLGKESRWTKRPWESWEKPMSYCKRPAARLGGSLHRKLCTKRMPELQDVHQYW